jgi:hypothetical protein
MKGISFSFSLTCALAVSCQAPNKAVVVTNQTHIPVVYQFLRGSEWQTATIKVDQTIMAGPGCLRFSTGGPHEVVYVVLQTSERYAFVGSGNQIRLVYHEANGKDAPAPVSSSYPACVPTSK